MPPAAMYLGAYLMAVIGGKESPTPADITAILEASRSTSLSALATASSPRAAVAEEAAVVLPPALPQAAAAMREVARRRRRKKVVAEVEEEEADTAGAAGRG